MRRFIILTVVAVFVLVSCSESDSIKTNSKLKKGISILNTPRHGIPNFVSDSSTHAYFNISTTITNDTTIPIAIDLKLDTSYNHFDKSFRAYLLAQYMNVDAQRQFSFFRDTVLPYLHNYKSYPTKISKQLQPGESYTVNIGYLSAPNSDFGPGQLAILSQFHKYNFMGLSSKDVQVPENSEPNTLNLYLGLNFSTLTDSLYGFKLVPLGKVIYLKK